MVCNSSKDVINSNRLPLFLFTLIWLLSEDASDASGILGWWGDSQVWRWYQRMDNWLGPLPTTMGNMTNKGKWAIDRQPRVVEQRMDDGQWATTIGNKRTKGRREGKRKPGVAVTWENVWWTTTARPPKRGGVFFVLVQLDQGRRSSVSFHGNQIYVIVLQYAAALASPGRKRKTKAMSVHFTSISLGSRCAVNLENFKC